MADFQVFKLAVQKRLETISANNLFIVDVEKDELWDAYLEAFPEGENKIYKTRREYDCQCCKHFIRKVGGVVEIDDSNNISSIWEVTVPEPFATVTKVLNKIVLSKSIKNVFLSGEKVVGVDVNRQMLEDGSIRRWNHFSANLNSQHVENSVSLASKLGEHNTNFQLLTRGLVEISKDSCDIVLDLISQGSLYRGEEHKSNINKFLQIKNIYEKIPDTRKRNFVWQKSKTLQNFSRFRNSVIGTLLVDISNNIELEDAVKMYESKVAPQNYKRPKSLVTAAMVKQAEEKVDEMGIESSLHRRHAFINDITVNNLLFTDRSPQKSETVFDGIASNKFDKRKFKDAQKIHIDKFIQEVLPNITSMEVLFENRLEKNLMSLIAPVYEDTKNLFKWDNNFSWSYNGEVTDSIKDRVKKAGGNVNAVLRCSLAWHNTDDLDIGVYEPNNFLIYYKRTKSHSTTGFLDVDMNVSESDASRKAVENICWTDINKLLPGEYKLYVNNFCQRESVDFGFEVEIEFNGKVYYFNHSSYLKDAEKIAVATFQLSEDKQNLSIIKSIPESSNIKNIWGIDTETFVKVRMMMLSPNHWDDMKIGNKHWFFMLEGCKNETRPRGFYNEFLRNEFEENRKVFEILGSKMKAQEPEFNHQLSGIGFSSTQRNSVIVRVKGSFTRRLEIEF